MDTLKPIIIRGDYNTYQGAVACLINGAELWREKTGINRMTPQAAIDDAITLATELTLQAA